MLAELIEKFNVRVPVKMLEINKYLIGTKIVRARIDGNRVL